MSEVMHFKIPKFSDDRGAFNKLFSNVWLSDYRIKQVNLVTSHKAVLRGLHYQQGEAAEAKLFTVLNGRIQLAWLDVSTGTCGSEIINAEENAVFIPRGYATGYLVLEENTTVLYYSDNDYTPEAEAGVRWNDPVMAGISWQISNPVVSEKDLNWRDFQ